MYFLTSGICLVTAWAVCSSASEIQTEVLPGSLLTLDGRTEEKTAGNLSQWTSALKKTEEICNSTHRCQNGGKCYGVCMCLKGTSGDFCEDVEGCRDRNCDFILFHCAYNVKNQRAECFCDKENYYYNESTMTCSECSCGKYGDCISSNGKKTCSCYKGFAYVHSYYEEHECKRCDCGLWSTGCKYDKYDSVCTCQKGFAQNLQYKAEKCQLCDCGDNGVCSFEADHSDIYGVKKICNCNKNYEDLNGYCEECNCGEGVKCEFSKVGKKICHCQLAEGMKDRKCTACDCGLENVSCTFNSRGTKHCVCPPGYQDRGGQCEDVDECQGTNACPFSTQCENKNGTYDCVCAEGFKLSNATATAKIRGCDDVDECAVENACSPNAVCVNTLGSYGCMCFGEYTATSEDDDPRNIQCTDNTSDAWKIPGILFIVVLITLSLTSVFILYKNRIST